MAPDEISLPEDVAALFAESTAAPETAPEVPASPDTVVHLPGGWLDINSGQVVRTAEVRELNGEDEEVVLRVVTDYARMMDTLLQRGVVKVGDSRATKDLLDSLLSADRNALLLGVRRATFGDTVDFRDVKCPHCGDLQDVEVSLERDVPVTRLADSERDFIVTTKSGKKIQCSLPDGHTEKALTTATDSSIGGLNTALLRSCVKAIDGMPAANSLLMVTRNLSWRDRQEILKEINERNPGPQLQEVSRPCEACSEPISLPLNMVDLFRI